MALAAPTARRLPAYAGADAPAGGSSTRDPFLDVVRTIALLRVVVWHAIGAAAITYIVAAVPAMFFVTGSLLAKSLSGRTARAVVADRLRRVLIPLWAFGAVVWLVLAGVHAVDGTAGTALPVRDLVFWILPLNDPKASPWEGGYVTAPLWYLRALVWLFLLAPLLWWLVRRARTLTLTALVGAIAILEILARSGSFRGTVAWRIGDGFVYGLFLVLGFVHRQGGFDRYSVQRWLGTAAVAAAAAAAWIVTQPVPDHVVNDSHPAHVLVGLTWLALFMAARPLLVGLGTHRVSGRVVRFCSQRSITIYLWHPPAVVLTYLALRRFGTLPTGIHTMLLLVGATFVVVLAVVAFGWIEDLANRRAPCAWPATSVVAQVASPPHRRHDRVRPASSHPPVLANVAIAAAMVIVALAGGLPWTESVRTTHIARAAAATPDGATAADPSTPTLPSTSASASTTVARSTNPIGLRVPSQQPKSPTVISAPSSGSATSASPITTSNAASMASENTSTGASTISEAEATYVTATFSPSTVSAGLPSNVVAGLAAATSAFAASEGLPGVQVAVYKGGTFDWTYAQGDDLYGNPLDVNVAYDIASATKSFTAALVWQAIDEGLIDPDAPLPRLAAVPDFPYYRRITVRQLLAHTSGLPNYRATAGYEAAARTLFTPEEAVAWVGDEPLLFAPGSHVAYSSTNYLVLGFVLEQVTGQNYDDLLTRMLEEAGIFGAVHAPAEVDLPNFSTSGLMLTANQLARWGVALFDENTPALSAYAFDSMKNIDVDSTIGEGIEAYCPCTLDRNGTTHWTAYGYAGSVTLFEYAPATGVSIAVNLSASLYEPDTRIDAVLSYVEELRQLVAGL
ncbi:MAG: serine hydrolase [Acidimicrobiia bacterium]